MQCGTKLLTLWTNDAASSDFITFRPMGVNRVDAADIEAGGLSISCSRSVGAGLGQCAIAFYFYKQKITDIKFRHMETPCTTIGNFTFQNRH